MRAQKADQGETDAKRAAADWRGRRAESESRRSREEITASSRSTQSVNKEDCVRQVLPNDAPLWGRTSRLIVFNLLFTACSFLLKLDACLMLAEAQKQGGPRDDSWLTIHSNIVIFIGTI